MRTLTLSKKHTQSDTLTDVPKLSPKHENAIGHENGIRSPSVKFINVLRAAFMRKQSKSAKKTDIVNVFLKLLDLLL